MFDFRVFVIPYNARNLIGLLDYAGQSDRDSGVATIRVLSFNTFAHEFGHSIGLEHSGKCTSSIIPCPTGKYDQYADFTSIMSRGFSDYWLGLNAYNLNHLGYLKPDNLATVTSNGVWTLRSLSSYTGSGYFKYAMRIKGVGRDKWIEWRQLIGMDVDLNQVFSPTSQVNNLLVHERRGSGRKTILIRILTVGQSVTFKDDVTNMDKLKVTHVSLGRVDVKYL